MQSLIASDGAKIRILDKFWDLSTCQECVENDKIKYEKFLLTVRFEPTDLSFVARCSTNWATRAFMKADLSKWFLYIHELPICIHWYGFENYKEDRILSCTCTVWCYILEYTCIYIWQNAMSRTNPVFVSTWTTRPNTLRSSKISEFIQCCVSNFAKCIHLYMNEFPP